MGRIMCRAVRLRQLRSRRVAIVVRYIKDDIALSLVVATDLGRRPKRAA